MEDILASIRRILNEDEAPVDAQAPPVPEPARPAGAPPAVEAPPDPAPRDEAPLELTEAMMVSDRPPAPAPEPPASDALLAPSAAAASAAALGKLAAALVAERAAAVSRGGPSIEDVVREEMRPLLKAWLDAHLAPMVQRLVQAEIERVVARTLT